MIMMIKNLYIFNDFFHFLKDADEIIGVHSDIIMTELQGAPEWNYPPVKKIVGKERDRLIQKYWETKEKDYKDKLVDVYKTVCRVERDAMVYNILIEMNSWFTLFKNSYDEGRLYVMELIEGGRL